MAGGGGGGLVVMYYNKEPSGSVITDSHGSGRYFLMLSTDPDHPSHPQLALRVDFK